MQKMHIKHAIHVRKSVVRERKWEIEGVSYIIILIFIFITNNKRSKFLLLTYFEYKREEI